MLVIYNLLNKTNKIMYIIFWFTVLLLEYMYTYSSNAHRTILPGLCSFCIIYNHILIVLACFTSYYSMNHNTVAYNLLQAHAVPVFIPATTENKM